MTLLYALFIAAVGASLWLTYYHTIVLRDYVAFTDTETVPDAADFPAYLLAKIGLFTEE